MRVRPRLARLLLRLTRWRVTGTLRAPGVFVGAPHTSNWDFVLAMLVLWSFGIRPKALVKREAFVGPLAPVLRALGAVPTERKGTGGLVARLEAEAARNPDFVLVLAAEGTRSRTEYWRSGFYRLARSTGLQVTFCWVDGPTRTVGLSEPIDLTGDVSADMDRVRAIYAHARGVLPGKVNVPRLRAEDEPAGDDAPGAGTLGDRPGTDGDAPAT